MFEVRDIWPESAVVLGELSNPRFIKIAEKIELFYYKKASRVIVVTQGIYNSLKNRGIDPDKMSVIKNGTNTDIFKNYGSDKRVELKLENKFIVMYAGIFGIAQGMEQLCELVEQMKKSEDIHFVFIGNGPKRKTVESIKNEKNLSNLTLLDEIPRDEIPKYLSAAQVCIVPLRKNELFKGALPSKIFDYMACERPVILCVAGEASEVMEQAQAGLVVEPENTKEMIAAINKLKTDPDKTQKYGVNGRNFVEEKFSRKKQAIQLENTMMEIVN
jgi:glycosyltransferase involved in cell wall biosynthesis